MADQRPLIAAVPELNTYQPQTGLGRVFHSLRTHWGTRVRTVSADFVACSVPVLRNFPSAVRPSTHADVVLLPKLTGALALRNTTGIPSVVIVHDIGIVDFPGDREGLSWLNYYIILQSFRALRHASRVVAVSRFSQDRLVHYLPYLRARVCVVPNGVSDAFLNHHRTPAQSRRRVEQMVGRPLGAPILLYVGSELPRKNIPLLLDVFKRIKARYPAAQLIKAGSAGHARWRARTLEMVRQLGLHIGADVLLIEDIDDTSLVDVYRAADVFVSASLYEGFGLPALEAMAVGTPVVVANRGALPEVVGEVGWVVEPEPEQFMQAIGAALTDPSRHGRMHQGQATAARWTWARAAEEYLGVINEVRKSSTTDVKRDR